MSNHNRDDYDENGNPIHRTSPVGGAVLMIGAALGIYGFYYILAPPLALAFYVIDNVLVWLFWPDLKTKFLGPDWMVPYLSYLIPIGVILALALVTAVTAFIVAVVFLVFKKLYRVVVAVLWFCALPFILTFAAGYYIWRFAMMLRSLFLPTKA